MAQFQPKNAASEASKILHVRGLSNQVTENDITHALSSYGNVQKVLLLAAKGQAFVQLDSLEAAAGIVDRFGQGGLPIRNKPAYFQYSNHEELKLQTPSPNDAKQPQANNILLVTVLNCRVQVTIEHLHTIFKPFGIVQKIIIFSKNSVFQALVQMASVESAANARHHLDGKDIFQNCCHLRIAFSNNTDLKVTKNSPKARDFSQPEPAFPQAAAGAPLSINPGPAAGGQLMQSPWALQQGAYSAANAYQNKSFPPNYDNGGAAAAGGPGCVLLVNNVPPKITPDNLFILFGVYGDVMRVKILHKKTDTALVQFASPQQAQLALLHLNRLPLMGKELAIAVSKHNEVSLPKEGSAEYNQASSLTKDFSHSKIHRYVKSGRNARNINPPSRVLHVSNLPDNATEDQLRKLFHSAVEAKVAPVVQFFTNNRKQCFVRLESTNQAVVGLIRLHNHKLSDRYIRVSFSNRDPNAVTNEPAVPATGTGAQDKKQGK